jgi:SET domain-containing protein
MVTQPRWHPADRGFLLVASEEHGFRFPYIVEKTKDKGLGVFAAAAIKQGSIVWQHVKRQYVVYDEQSFKAAIEQMSRAEVVYELTHVFGLKEFSGCLIRIRDDGVLVNHSSNPNLATINATACHTSLDAASPQFLSDVTVALLDDRYALVATRDIEEGEEFTIDYNVDVVDPRYYDVLFDEHGINEDFLNDR